MGTSFVPPRPDQWQGPADASGGFTPPPPSAWQGPSDETPQPNDRIGNRRQPKHTLTGREEPQKSAAGQAADLIEGTGKYASGALLPALALNPVGTIGGLAAGLAGQKLVQTGAQAMGASPDTARLAGDVAAIPAGMYGSKGVEGAGDFIRNARTPNPDLAFQNAVSVHPNDTEFSGSVPAIREGIQRGSQLTGNPVTDPRSAVEATEAAQAELIDALSHYKTNARRTGTKLPVADIKAAQISAIPKGLEDSNPDEYHAIVQAIQEQFPHKSELDVDDVFTQSRLNNARLKAFYAGKEGTQNSKLMTNSGDASVLKAAGDTYRQWIADNLGRDAANINEQWGNLNGAKHYLQGKINPSVREQPVTQLEGALDKTGLDLGSNNPMHGVIRGVANKIIGRPNSIDGYLRSTFENTHAASPPPIPDLTPYRLAPPPDPSGPVYNPLNNPMQSNGQKQLPPASSGIGVSGTTVPDFLGRSTRGSGSPRPLLPAPTPGQAPTNVLPTGKVEFLGKSPRSWANPPGDTTGKDTEITPPRGKSVIDKQGIDRDRKKLPLLADDPLGLGDYLE